MSTQTEIFGANPATPLVGNKRWSAPPRSAAEPKSSSSIAGLGWGDIYFIPRAKLEIGIRVVRFDDCRRCGRDTSHVFTLIAFGPRTWARACLECRHV